MSRKQSIFALKILGTVVLCTMLYRAVPWHEVVAGAARIDLALLSFGLLLFVPQTLLSAWRWRAMLKPLANVSFGDSLRQTLAGSALNLIVPAKLGDLSKVAMVPNEPSLRKQAALRAIMEKLGDVGMLLAAIGLGFLRLNTLSATLVACGFAGGLMLLKRLQSRSFDYAAWLASTAILWTLHLSQIHFFLLACGVEVSFAATLQRAPIALFAGLIPAAFCGIGTRDAALVWLFADVAAAPTMALVGMLTALRYLVPGAVGIPVLLSLRRATPQAKINAVPEQPTNRVASRRPTVRAAALPEAR